MAKIYYTFCYTTRPDSGPILKKTVPIPNIRLMAKHLNCFVAAHKGCRIIVCFVSDVDGKFIKLCNFLKDEYKAQRWLVGNKERLLANALERGFDIKWNHGLKPRSDA